eukprot:TRINITY_DN3079_c0_g1_i2.p1 TRINITY_DN3079_c0_g1~~TRINITY_DN3079_c0_g1_i2.p1  ORF type:complete len:257 (-),score=88.47 TRINITY_DN3079_c0_g1_i2:320-1090(-)
MADTEDKKEELVATSSEDTEKKEAGAVSTKENDESRAEEGGHDDSIVSNPDPYYPPIVSLPEVEVKTGEDDEDEIFKLRAKLYRYAPECDPPEWKERGTGDIRILQHKIKNSCRIVMRREKTMRLCANHAIQPWMELMKHSSNEKVWVWRTYADFADEVKKPETLAARFSTPENAKKWKDAFGKAVQFVLEKEAESYLREKNGQLPLKSKEATKESEKSDPENKENIVSGGEASAEEKVSQNATEVTNKLDNLTVN